MSNVNAIQNKILELSGGAFERLFDAYVYKKFGFNNIQTLGVQTGTDKTTKGTPDSYVITEGKKYILITCGSVTDDTPKKIRADILSCFNKAKLDLDKDKIQKLICGHISSNIHIEQFEDLRSMLGEIEVELIGIGTISHDLAYKYPNLAKEYLNVSVDTHQIFNIEDFVSNCDKSKINAPIDCDFFYRENELAEIIESVKSNEITIVIGVSGVGKTRVVLEACRKCELEGWRVLCVKSNGNLLYDDIRYYVDQEGEYLLFFDDANLIKGFEGILDYVLSLSEKYKVRMIFTVRDYAKKHVTKVTFKHVKPKLIKIDEFRDEEIANILRNNLNIDDHLSLKRITDIACGNVRVAMLAGLKLINSGLPAIRNATDVFQNYYGEIMSQTTLVKEDILFLCVISITGPIRMRDNALYRELMDRLLPDLDSDSLLQKLYGLELVDWFKDEIVNTSDQSFGDYVLYYVFYEKKLFPLRDLILLAFPKYREKVLYVINTLLKKFLTEDLRDFVGKQINEAWDTAPSAYENAYLEVFYQVNPIKSLLAIKNVVVNDEHKEFNFTIRDLEGKKNNNTIQTPIIEILSGYKYLECFDEALELLFAYLEKRADLFMDFYHAIINNTLYDEKSYYHKYSQEALLLSELWNRCDNGNNYVFTLLYIFVAEYALATEFRYLEEGRKHRNVTFCKSTTVLTNEMKDIRSGIWRALFKLRKDGRYKEKIDELITKRHVNGLYEDVTKEYVIFDFDQIYPFIKDDIDFINAKVLGMYREDALCLKMEVDNRMLRANENEYYRIFNLLTREHEIGRSIREDEIIRKKAISDEILNYSNTDFHKLFEACKYICKVESKNVWDLDSGINIVFELLEEDEEKYKKVLDIFFSCGAPGISYYKNRIVQYMMYHYGYFDSKALLCKYEFESKNAWLYVIWEGMSEESVSKEIAADFEIFIRENERVIPDPYTLSKYVKLNPVLKNYMLDKLDKNPSAGAIFLRGCFRDENVARIVDLFEEKIDLLCEIYINALDSDVDDNGNMFFALYDRNPEIWERYVEWLKEHHRYDGSEQHIMDRMWETQEYSERISLALDSLDDGGFIYINEIAKLIFHTCGNKTTDEKKKKWLVEQLETRSKNLKRCKSLINIVAIVYPEWEVDYVLEFLKYNKNIDDFKELYFFSMESSWSGSQIPLINGEIEFLMKLSNGIKGIEFLEHKVYLATLISNKEKYKDEVELREYLENA